MFAFDRVLVNPSKQDLDGALAEASAAANRGFRSRLLALTANVRAKLHAALKAAPEGCRQWHNDDRSQSQTFSAAGVAWWTDHLGRKHCRVVARRPSIHAAARSVFAVEKDLDLPPLALTYPDETFLREDGSATQLVAVCRCGVFGDPEVLGWMGASCGPCHDRREHGEAIPGAEFPARTVLTGRDRWVQQVVFTPDGRTLLVRPLFGNRIDVWDLATGAAHERSFFGGRQVTALALAPDGRAAAVGLDRGGCLFWHPKGSGEAPPLQTQRPLTSLAFSPDSATLAALGGDRVLLFDTMGRVMREIAVEVPIHPATQALAFTPDGRLLAVGWQEDDEPVRLFDATTGREQARLGGYLTDLSSLSCAPDGRAFAAGVDVWDDASLRVWRWPGGGEILTSPKPVAAVTFSPDSRLLAAGGADGRLRLWDVSAGAAVGVFCWNGCAVGALAFSPDGRWLAAGDHDGRVRLWPVDALCGRA